MRFKLDENFGRRTQQLFRDAGHDVQTVAEENLRGIEDQRLHEVCQREARCLITLDLDFSDVTRFPPLQSHGLVVIRPPRNPTLPLLEQLIRQLLQAIDAQNLSPHRNLWMVEIGRIRIYQPSQ